MLRQVRREERVDLAPDGSNCKRIIGLVRSKAEMVMRLRALGLLITLMLLKGTNLSEPNAMRVLCWTNTKSRTSAFQAAS